MSGEAREVEATQPGTAAGEPLHASPLPLRDWLRLDVCVLLLIFMLFYFFRLAEFSLSIDDELGALHATPNVWIQAGRWAGYLFDRFLLPQSTLPFLPILLFGLFLSMSYAVVLSAFGIKRLNLVHYLAFPLYAALPTWTFLAAFAANIAAAGIGLLLAACAVLQFARLGAAAGTPSAVRGTRLAAAIAIGALPLAVAIALYQSFLLAFACLSVALLLAWSLREELVWGTLLRRLALLGTLVLAAVILYALTDEAFRSALNLHDRTYISAFANWRILLASPLTTGLNVLAAMFDVYAGRPAIYGVAAFALPLVIALGFAAIVGQPHRSAAQRLLSLTLAACMLGVPFLQHFLSGGNMPARTLVAVPAVFWFFALAGLTSPRRAIAAATLAACALGVLQIVYSSTMLHAANHFARVHDQQLAAAIHERIVALHPEPDARTPYTVDLFGASHFDTIYPRPFSSTAGFSFFEWDDGNASRILSYMRMIGYTDLQAASPEQRQRDAAAFAAMPIWPARDSVRLVGDVTLVKLAATSSLPR